MVIIQRLILLLALILGVPEAAKADDDNWRMYVAFLEKEVGSVNKLPQSYEILWVRRDGNEKELGKRFKTERKETVAGTKDKIYTREVTTNSTALAAIFKYTRDFEMWSGPKKTMSALKLVKGKDLEHLKTQMDHSAQEYDYFGYDLVALIDMQAAKAFLNIQGENPFSGTAPQMLAKIR